MKKFNSQAETHSGPSGAPRTSSPKRELCCNFATAYFFLFLNRLQAQAHSGPGSLPRDSRLNLFFFIYI